jgi:hypothetical protein
MFYQPRSYFIDMKKKNTYSIRHGEPFRYMTLIRPDNTETNMPVASNKGSKNYKWTVYVVLSFFVLFISLLSACKKKETEVVPVPTISSINKSTLNVGDTLVISGENFNNDPSKDLVSVASVSYTVIKASSTQISAIVPKGAQSGKLSIGFDEGQSTTYSQSITIIGATSPIIRSITPTAGAYENDTVVIHGSNFGIPYNTNSITFNGVAGKIYNVTDTVMRVIVPNLSSSGPVQITTNGVNSPAFQYNILKVDPNADGHFYWMIPLTTFSYNTYTYINTENVYMRGSGNTVSPQSAVIYDLVNNNGIWPSDPNPYDGFYYYGDMGSGYQIDNTIVNDSQDKYGYYLAAASYPFPASYSVERLTLSGSATTPVPVWSQTYTKPTYTEFISNPTDTIDYPPVYVHYTPDQQFTADGNTAYIKMGLSDDYLVGDLSATSPTFTLQKNVFGDPNAYEPKFGQNFIFYQEIGTSGSYDNSPDAVTQIRYEARGSKTSAAIPLTFTYNEELVNVLADPSHGDNVLIITFVTDPTTNFQYNNIYKFNADTKQLVKLYSRNNWRDAAGATAYTSPGNSGFAWEGTHIYYCSTSGSPVSQNGQILYSAMYRLNDNGSSPKIYTVYGRMEPLNFSAAAPSFSLFLGQ